MRHDPAGASIVIMLRSLKLYGMANAIEDLVAQGAPAFEAATPMLSQLLKAEIAEREVRSIAYHTKVARFPAYKDLTGFDFASSEVNEATVRQLHRCEFIEAAENVVLIGGPGTGKSHTATAIGVQAIEHHRPSGMQGFAFNTRRKVFSDPLVREALAYGFDFQWANKNLFYGLYRRTESYFENSSMKAQGLPSDAERTLPSSSAWSSHREKDLSAMGLVRPSSTSQSRTRSATFLDFGRRKACG